MLLSSCRTPPPPLSVRSRRRLRARPRLELRRQQRMHHRRLRPRQRMHPASARRRGMRRRQQLHPGRQVPQRRLQGPWQELRRWLGLHHRQLRPRRRMWPHRAIWRHLQRQRCLHGGRCLPAKRLLQVGRRAKLRRRQYLHRRRVVAILAKRAGSELVAELLADLGAAQKHTGLADRNPTSKKCWRAPILGVGARQRIRNLWIYGQLYELTTSPTGPPPPPSTELCWPGFDQHWWFGFGQR